LLATLAGVEYRRLRSFLEPVVLRHQQVLYEPGEVIARVYFPITAVVSLLNVVEDGKSLGTATVGSEGLIGLPLALGADSDNNRAVVQVAGTALRVGATAFRRALERSDALRHVVQRYTHVVLVQTAQAAVCNRLHSTHARCSRWLLEIHDRVRTDVFNATQDFLAEILGVRRPTVTAAAGLLQQAGLIHYRRGRVTILNRPGLESAACGCYRTVAIANERLLGAAPRAS
jgi:CRP-like cAMP-binding protein